MRIVFGWNHFKIKSFDPRVIGISQTTQPDFSIEVRQSYFHLFWIPCFGLGKKWSIRKSGQLYEMPAVYKDALRGRSDLRVKTPWYTYAGPLLLGIVGLGFMINEKVAEHRAYKYNKKEFEAQYANNAARFRKPSPDDYYVLTPVSGYSAKYARVTGIDKKNIQLSYIPKFEGWVSMSKPLDIAKLFVDPANKTETITLSRGDSARLICTNYDERHTFKGIELNGERNELYRVEKIYRLDGPLLTDGHYASWSANEINMEILNEGLAGTLTKIESTEGKIQWSCAKGLPLSLLPGKDFMITGAGNYKQSYKVKFTVEGEDGRSIQYLLEGKEMDRHLTRIN